MSSLANQQIKSSFNGILQVPGGITSSLQTVQDGNGNPTGLQISSTAISGATASNFVPSVAGIQVSNSVQRLINDGFGDLLSVKDFGAIGDGVTDDTAAFTNALDTGRDVYVPAGTYVISGALYLKSTASLHGEGTKKSILKCKTSSFTGIFLNVNAYTKIDGIDLVADGPAAGTAIKLWDNINGQYSFTGHIKIENVSISGFDVGIFVNNIFLFDLQKGIIEDCNFGTKISPAYDGVGDNGYVTTLSFNEVSWFANVVNIYANPTLVSKNISFKQCGIENATSGSYQSYFSNCGLLHFYDCYFEGSSSIPVVKLYNCNTTMQSIYCNGTGGIDLGGDSNTFIANSFSGTSSTDKLNATGTSIQNVQLNNCAFGSASSINSARTSFYNTTIGATLYRNVVYNPSLALTDNLSAYSSTINSFLSFSRTIASSTISANTTVNLISDYYSSGIFNDSYVVGVAQITNLYHPGLLLSVTPATTGSADYFCVTATNTTASSITLTNALLKIIFFKGQAVAI